MTTSKLSKNRNKINRIKEHQAKMKGGVVMNLWQTKEPPGGSFYPIGPNSDIPRPITEQSPAFKKDVVDYVNGDRANKYLVKQGDADISNWLPEDIEEASRKEAEVKKVEEEASRKAAAKKAEEEASRKEAEKALAAIISINSAVATTGIVYDMIKDKASKMNLLKITKGIINGSYKHMTDAEKIDFEIELMNFDTNTQDLLSILFDDLENLSHEELTEKRDKLYSLYSEFKISGLKDENLKIHKGRYKELKKLINALIEEDLGLAEGLEEVISENSTNYKKITIGRRLLSDEENIMKIKDNILKHFNKKFLNDRQLKYTQIKEKCTKINLYRMILDIYIFYKGQTDAVETGGAPPPPPGAPAAPAETAAPAAAPPDIPPPPPPTLQQRQTPNKAKTNKVIDWNYTKNPGLNNANMFYMVLMWFNKMKEDTHLRKTFTLTPRYAEEYEGYIFESILDTKKSIITEETKKLTFTQELIFLKNYNNLIKGTTFNKYLHYLNTNFGGLVNNEFNKIFPNGRQGYENLNELTQKYEYNTDNNNNKLKNEMTKHFKSITEDYSGGPTCENINDAIVYARYIDVIQILKKRGDYSVDRKNIKNYIDKYIEEGNNNAWEYINDPNKSPEITVAQETDAEKEEQNNLFEKNNETLKVAWEELSDLGRKLQPIAKTNTDDDYDEFFDAQ
jgi:hypothetical protein